jgi:hypothetical protein
MPTKVTVRARVVLDVPVSGAWSKGTSVEQIVEQATSLVNHDIQKLFVSKDVYLVSVDPRITVTISKE